MYPILIRLADRGLLETCWESEHVPGRPARHLYRLTAAGREYAAEAIAAGAIAAGAIAAGAIAAAGPGPATGAPARGPVRPRWEGA
jgi:DNA-binding PadR family transcriptional regulator